MNGEKIFLPRHDNATVVFSLLIISHLMDGCKNDET